MLSTKTTESRCFSKIFRPFLLIFEAKSLVHTLLFHAISFSLNIFRKVVQRSSFGLLLWLYYLSFCSSCWPIVLLCQMLVWLVAILTHLIGCHIIISCLSFACCGSLCHFPFQCFLVCCCSCLEASSVCKSTKLPCCSPLLQNLAKHVNMSQLLCFCYVYLLLFFW